MLIREARLPTRVLVHVRAQAGVFNATIGNLSAGGARLCGVPDDGPRAGEVVQIEYAGLRSLAQILQRGQLHRTCLDPALSRLGQRTHHVIELYCHGTPPLPASAR